jgi:hypothetical protein
MRLTFLLCMGVLCMSFTCNQTIGRHLEPNVLTNHLADEQPNKKKPKIQVALLLDTSNSMDGLIDQAKSQLWKMVNALATSKKNGESPIVELALYDYGNSSLSAQSGYVRMHTNFTYDLDKVSEVLFGLSTNGGEEYCGQVIQTATQELNWSDDKDDYKVIIIAGNEPFTQGSVNYKEACKTAIRKGIIINTIHCGDYQVGVDTKWKDGADLADGKYMNINQNDKVVHISTPYDQRIIDLNEKLNSTYIGYGTEGKKRKEVQIQQDANAATYGSSNMAERAMSKVASSRAPAAAKEWDIVDAAKDDAKVLEKLEDEELPTEMKGMSEAERKQFIEQKSNERAAIQAQIESLDKERRKYVQDEQAKNSTEAQTLDNVLIKTVKEQAKSAKFEFDN